MSDENNNTSPDAEEEVVRIRLVRKTKKVDVEDENNKVQRYTLCEMVGAQRDKWLNNWSARVRTDRSGNVIGMKTFDDLQAALIAKCLYDENGELVKQEVISRWPATAQKQLFELCQKMNGLDSDSEEEEKKD